MGDHGRDIELKGGGWIGLNSGPLLDGSLQTSTYKDIQRFESRMDSADLLIKRLEPTRVGSMPAYRYLATSWNSAGTVVREAVVILLPWGTEVVVSIEAPKTSTTTIVTPTSLSSRA